MNKMNLLQQEDQVVLVALSNALGLGMKEKIETLCRILSGMGIMPICSQYLYGQNSVRGGNASEKARELEAFYQNPRVKVIFDVSGGNIANEVLCELDYDKVRKYFKPFWGYSDLTTIVNALYQKTGKSNCLYQICNLVGADGERQRQNFFSSIYGETDDLFQFSYEFIQGNSMSGVVVGGNIRCFLKLAGTPFMPNLGDKILLLESRSGSIPEMITYLSQYKQLGAFDKVNGILLGTFTEMEQEKYRPTIEELVLEIANRDNLPIAKTKEIGHGADSKAIWIGQELELC